MLVVFTCDVINSRKNTQEMENLNEKLVILNRLLELDLMTNINSSRGDEVQFILKFNQNFFQNIMLFRAILYPLQLRMAGSLIERNQISLISENSWDLNGEPFFLTRAVLENNLKKDKKSCIYFKSRVCDFDYILNSFFILNDIILNKWRDSQWELIKEFLQIPDKRVLALKFNLKVTDEKISSTLYDRLNRLQIEEIRRSEQELLNYFKKRGIIAYE